MTDAELCERIGIPGDCPDDIVRALIQAKVDHWTREGTKAVQVAAREQASWKPEQKEEARLRSLRCLRNRA